MDPLIFFGGLLFVAAPTIYLYRRLRPRLELPPDGPTADSRESAKGEAELAYLATFRTAMRMPDGMADEEVQEVTSRIEASRASLVAAGKEPDEATRETLAGMGQPGDLAAKTRRANQTRRRLSLGVAGAVLAIPGAYLAGTAIGWVLTLPALTAGLVVYQGGFLVSKSVQSNVSILILGVACLYVARTGVRVLSGISGRAPAAIGIWTALIGTPVVLGLVLCVLQEDQSWPTFIAEMLVPVGFAAGAIYQVRRSTIRLPLIRGIGPNLTLVLGAYAILGLVGGMALTSIADSRDAVYGAKYDATGPWPIAQLWKGQDLAGPFWIGAWELAPAVIEAAPGAGSDPATGADQLPGWTDLRFEVWPGVEGAGPFPGVAVASGAAAPTLTASASWVPSKLDAPWTDHFQGPLKIGMRRDGRIWFVIFTGLAPDGKRYQLSNALLLESNTNGTPWDWLTAPG